MEDRHIFNKETDSEMLAMDIVTFLRKWGMWQDVQIFTGGKCYTDNHGELVVRNEEHPEEYLAGISHYDCEGNCVWEDFSNPERFLDMTFEGAFSLLLRHHEYEVKIKDVADEVRHIILPETFEFDSYEEWLELIEYCDMDLFINKKNALDGKEIEFLSREELMEDYLKGKYSWDPAEFDSYEEWLELNQYCDMDLFINKKNALDGKEVEFSSREEYEDFLMCHAVERELEISEYLDEWDTEWVPEVFYDRGRIASMIIEEFNDLLERYGLWYDLCFSWSLTTYRI